MEIGGLHLFCFPTKLLVYYQQRHKEVYVTTCETLLENGLQKEKNGLLKHRIRDTGQHLHTSRQGNLPPLLGLANSLDAPPHTSVCNFSGKRAMMAVM